MKNSDHAIRGLLRAIKIGLWLVPVLPLYVPTSLIYPFTTGRNFAFRIIVEVVFILWLGLIALDRSYRPRGTIILHAISLFLFVTFIANILSPNPWRAFFSDYERMGGFISTFHYYLYFLLLISAFRTTRDWLIFFVTSLTISSITVIVALLNEAGVTLVVPGGIILAHKARAEATLGNSSYLAGYLLFHTWLALLYATQSLHHRKRMIAFGAVVGLCLTGIYFTSNRSAVLSIMISVSSLAGLSIYLGHKTRLVNLIKERLRTSLIIIFSAVAILVVTVRSYEVLQSDTLLSRLIQTSVSDYSAEGTINTRLIIWTMALKGVVERPILGWGQENFYLPFQKYFDPRLHDKEKHFDRAHNIFVDRLLESGIIGLSSYVLIWIAIIKVLIASVRTKQLLIYEGYLLAALLLSYLLHTSFHFDTFNTYFLFFSVVAYIQHRAQHTDKLRVEREYPNKLQYIVGPSAALIGIAVFYWTTVQPIREVLALRRAVVMAKSVKSADRTSVSDTYELFIRSLRHDTLHTGDADEHILREIWAITESPHMTNVDKKRFIELALSLLPETGKYYGDVRHLLTFAFILNSAHSLDGRYANIAEEVLSMALQLSPKKQDIYFEIAQLHLNKGDKKTALRQLRAAWELEPRYTDAAANLMTLSIVAQRSDIISKIEKSILLEHWTLSHLERIGTAYRMVADYNAAFRIYRRIATINAKIPEPHFWCGISQLHLQDYEAARVHFEEALRLGGEQTDAQRFLIMLEEME